MRSGWLRDSIYLGDPVLGPVFCSKTIIPEAQDHFLVSSGPRYTPSFGGLGFRWDTVLAPQWYILPPSFTVDDLLGCVFPLRHFFPLLGPGS